ncbi:hypothetical protein [Poseidonocella sp. HB161398]|uniref:hypothetical protein n=1 Tax=Poseidonocella sp. HB161398 TaxID=2320855 RepID=UPI001109D05B|nr:hypothetical protein [Poseidonocella sp. HB161398]
MTRFTTPAQADRRSRLILLPQLVLALAALGVLTLSPGFWTLLAVCLPAALYPFGVLAWIHAELGRDFARLYAAG